MTTRSVAVLVALTLLPVPTVAQSTEDDAAMWGSPPQPVPEAGEPDSAELLPSPPLPTESPQANPPATPAPPVQHRTPATASSAQGQWVYTQQYGWVWMPYGETYTYVPPDGYGEPYEYVYYPPYGWTWLAAPWVWGWGPWPYFGAYGAIRFAWYAHGWWRSPWRWHFAHVPFAGVHGGSVFHGIRSAPLRAGPFMRGVPARGFVGHPGGHAGGAGLRRGGHR